MMSWPSPIQHTQYTYWRKQLSASLLLICKHTCTHSSLNSRQTDALWNAGELAKLRAYSPSWTYDGAFWRILPSLLNCRTSLDALAIIWTPSYFGIYILDLRHEFMSHLKSSQQRTLIFLDGHLGNLLVLVWRLHQKRLLLSYDWDGCEGMARIGQWQHQHCRYDWMG
jgi:hypothetical protein